MKKNKGAEPSFGVLTNAMDTNTKEFKEFQLFISNKADSLSKKERTEMDLFSIEIQIEDYLSSNIQAISMITVGEFIRMYLDKLNIKQNALANYIGLKPSNFSKILSGSRKINFELSFILSNLFNLNPQVWMLIQIKNEYLEIKKNEAYNSYSLDDLLNIKSA